MENTLLDYLIRIIEIGSVSYGTIWYSKHLEKKNRKKKELATNNMDRDFERKSQVKAVLDEVRNSLEAQRVMECSFSNGDITFTGVHMKKVSVTMESNKNGVEDLAPHFQLVPAKVFERTLEQLYHSSDDYIFVNETLSEDELSVLNRSYGLVSMLLIKIRDEMNRWVAYMIVAYDHETELSEDEIVFAKMMAARLGVIK